MSYEGYIEYKCPNGHFDMADVYEEQPTFCQACGKRFARKRSVDETNDPTEIGQWQKIEGA